jgi:dolichyl-phosphate beta-glucosyltransferase
MDPAKPPQPFPGAAAIDSRTSGAEMVSGSAGGEHSSGGTTGVGPRVSIITPCRNGAAYLEESLGRLLEHIEARRDTIGECEVIFVDDGSTDGSAELVEKEFPRIRVLRHAINRGKGAAVRTGMLSAEGRFSIFIDADMPYGLDALETMLDYLDRKEFHLCIGTRSRGTSSALEKRSLARKLASVVFTAFVSRIVVTGIRDTQCGFKGFHTEIAQHLFGQSRVDNFAFDVEVLYLAFKNDLDIKRLPVRLEHDDDSSVSFLRHALPMLISIVQLPFRYHSGGYTLVQHSWEENP